MSIRYTLRTLREADVNLDNLKRHELCLTDTGKVMIRLHNDTIVDLSGAAAQYATTIANNILSTGQTLQNKITQWQKLDNEAIQVFNDIYDEVKDDKQAVTVLRQEVQTQYNNIITARNAAQTAATNAATSASQAQSYKNQVNTDKNTVSQIKGQVKDLLSDTQLYSSRAVNAATDAIKARDVANNASTKAEQTKQDVIDYANNANLAMQSAQAASFEAMQAKESALNSKQQAGISEQRASESATKARASEINASKSEASALENATLAGEHKDSALSSANQARVDASRVIEKEDTITEILSSHANVKGVTNDEIDEMWAETYIPEGTGLVPDKDGVYNLPIPIPKIVALFEGD